MGWNPTYRYKILGKLIRTQSDVLFVFDLSCAETYIKKEKGCVDDKRKAYYPEEWKNQFGVPVKEHEDMTLISIFDDYTVFKIQNTDESEDSTKNDSSNLPRYEEEKNSDSQTDTPYVE